MPGFSRGASLRAMVEVTNDDTDILNVPLEGWMQKRHRSGTDFWGHEWGKRWVWVNDEKGRMHVCKTKSRDASKGDIVFSMSDVSEIAPLQPTDKETAGLLHCFSVSQPPMHVVLHCADEQERRRWMEGLKARVLYWQEKRVQEGLVVAVSAKTAQRSSRPHLAESPSYGTGLTGTSNGFPLPTGGLPQAPLPPPPPLHAPAPVAERPHKPRRPRKDSTDSTTSIEEADATSRGGHSIVRAAALAEQRDELSEVFSDADDDDDRTQHPRAKPPAAESFHNRRTAW